MHVFLGTGCAILKYVGGGDAQAQATSEFPSIAQTMNKNNDDEDLELLETKLRNHFDEHHLQIARVTRKRHYEGLVQRKAVGREEEYITNKETHSAYGQETTSGEPDLNIKGHPQAISYTAHFIIQVVQGSDRIQTGSTCGKRTDATGEREIAQMLRSWFP